MRNVELLERVMQHIRDHPEQHDQGAWMNECGTAACFAGWACLLSGWRVGILADPWVETVVSPDGITERHVWLVAADLLGLTRDESGALFEELNTRPMLELMVKDLVNGDVMRDWDDYRIEASDA